MTESPLTSIGTNASVIGGTRSGVRIPQTRDIELFDDFIQFPISPDDGVGIGGWFESNAGGGDIKLVDGHGGLMAMTTASGADNQEAIASPSAMYLFNAAKEVYFEVRFQADAAAILDRSMYFGLTEGYVQGTDNATILAPLAHIGFSILGDDISFSHAGSAVSTTDTGVDLVAATNTILSFHYDGKGTYRAYVDGVLKVVESTGGTAHPDAVMRVFCSLENSSITSGAAIVTLDYVYYKLES